MGAGNGRVLAVVAKGERVGAGIVHGTSAQAKQPLYVKLPWDYSIWLLVGNLLASESETEPVSCSQKDGFFPFSDATSSFSPQVLRDSESSIGFVILREIIGYFSWIIRTTQSGNEALGELVGERNLLQYK
ncbi:hypothetical protein Trydic_g20061 [Trypoxylus dichotomus]